MNIILVNRQNCFSKYKCKNRNEAHSAHFLEHLNSHTTRETSMKLSDEMKQAIIQKKKENKYIPATAIIKELGLTVCRQRIQQILKEAENEGKL